LNEKFLLTPPSYTFKAYRSNPCACPTRLSKRRCAFSSLDYSWPNWITTAPRAIAFKRGLMFPSEPPSPSLDDFPKFHPLSFQCSCSPFRR
jgi:hypothetical protein